MPKADKDHQISDDLAIIADLSRSELIAYWLRAHRRTPAKGLSRRLLVYSAAYHLQAKTFGGLSPTVRRKLQKHRHTKVTKLKGNANRKSDGLMPGARLLRDWQGQTYTVEVLEDGFLYDGQHYTSLSKIARTITGARWSGPRFFGL